MSKIIIYSRAKVGHFESYSKIISKAFPEDVSVVHSFYKYLKIVKNTKNIDRTIFLYGERDWMLSILSRIIDSKTKLILIFYYGLSNNNGSKRLFLQKFILKFLRVLDIKVTQLEYFPNNFDKELTNYLIPLNDPPLLDYPKRPIDQRDFFGNEINILLPGYIDNRKCVNEIIKSIASLAKSYNDHTFNIRIAGQQSSEITTLLNKDHDFPSNFILTQINKKLSDKELEIEFMQSDLVLAIYKNHIGSSGVVINAIAFNKKVIFLNFGVMKEFRRELCIKEHLTDTDSESIGVAIENAIFKNHFKYSLGNRIEFLSKRSKKRFLNTIMDI